jgi:hypothetical protein
VKYVLLFLVGLGIAFLSIVVITSGSSLDGLLGFGVGLMVAAAFLGITEALGSPAPVFITTPDGQVVDANRVARPSGGRMLALVVLPVAAVLLALAFGPGLVQFLGQLGD